MNYKYQVRLLGRKSPNAKRYRTTLSGTIEEGGSPDPYTTAMTAIHIAQKHGKMKYVDRISLLLEPSSDPCASVSIGGCPSLAGGGQ
jgi:hypothetical protein